MLSVLLGVHFVLALAIIGLILLQKHDSDGALGSSGGGAASGMFSVRGQANLLTKSTAWLMTFFMINCLVMAKIIRNKPASKSIIERVAEESVLPIKKSAEKTPDGQPMPTPPSDLSKLKGPDGKPMPIPPSDLSKLKKPDGQPMPTPPSDLSKLKGPDGKPMPTPPSDLSKLKKPNQSQPAPAKPAKPTNTNPKNSAKK